MLFDIVKRKIMDRKIKRETRPRGRGQYHIQWCAANDIWPKGAWSLYRITGDEIAKRIEFGPPTGPYGLRPVVARHPWCGYIGMFEMGELEAAIEKDAQEVVTFVSYDAA
jgi:hypothetical protein